MPNVTDRAAASIYGQILFHQVFFSLGGEITVSWGKCTFIGNKIGR
jgi:hypothetical protein